MSDAQQPRIDVWTVEEQLYLVGAVRMVGEKNWASVSFHLKKRLEAPTDDWYSPKNCELQYNALLKKYAHDIRSVDQASGSGGGNSDTVADNIYKILEKEWMEELKKSAKESLSILEKLQEDLDLLDSDSTSKADIDRIEAEEEKAAQKDKEEHERFLAKIQKRNKELEDSKCKPVPSSAAVIDENSTETTRACHDLFSDLDNPDKREWKIQSQTVYGYLNKHLYSNTFTSNTFTLKGVASSDANSQYNSVVKCRMDLNAIKRNVALGAVRNIQELQRDFLLMLLNAATYYDLDDIMPSRHDMGAPKKHDGVKKRTETVGFKTAAYAKDINHQIQDYKIFLVTYKVGTSYASRSSKNPSKDH